MVIFCWPYSLVEHVQFWSSPGDFVPKSMRLRGLIVVLFCRIHDLDVQCANFVQSNCPGA